MSTSIRRLSPALSLCSLAIGLFLSTAVHSADSISATSGSPQNMAYANGLTNTIPGTDVQRPGTEPQRPGTTGSAGTTVSKPNQDPATTSSRQYHSFTPQELPDRGVTIGGAGDMGGLSNRTGARPANTTNMNYVQCSGGRIWNGQKNTNSCYCPSGSSWTGTTCYFPPPPPPAPTFGGAMACNALGCLMNDGTVRDTTGNSVGSYSVDPFGNIVGSVGNISVTFDVGGSASYNSSTGTYQTGNPIVGTSSANLDAYNLFQNQNTATITTAANGSQSIAAGNYGSLSLSTGQVFDANGSVVGYGTVASSGADLSFTNGSYGFVGFGSTNHSDTSNGNVLGNITAVGGAFAGVNGTVTNIFTGPPSPVDGQ